MDKERARQRILSHYHHLFPDLAGELERERLQAQNCVALDPAFDLPTTLVHKGWLSQPEVSLSCLFCLVWTVSMRFNNTYQVYDLI